LSHLDLSAGARRSTSISRFAQVFFIQSLLRPVRYRTAGTGTKRSFAQVPMPSIVMVSLTGAAAQR
jgi:hypothetical protein